MNEEKELTRKGNQPGRAVAWIGARRRAVGALKHLE